MKIRKARPRAIRMALRIFISGVVLVATVGIGGILRLGRDCFTMPLPIAIIHDKNVMPQNVMQVTGKQYREG